MLGKLTKTNELKENERRLSLEGYTPHAPEVGRTFFVASLIPIANESGYKFLTTSIVKSVERQQVGSDVVYSFQTDISSYQFLVQESFLDK